MPKAKDMVSKPRYWLVAYPLYITSLCVAPLEYFQQNWVACFEAGFNKLKVGRTKHWFFRPVTYILHCRKNLLAFLL